MSSLTTNRLKFLAQIALRSTNQALQRIPEPRRYPILVAFLYQTLVDLTDEAFDLFDRCLAEAYHRASVGGTPAPCRSLAGVAGGGRDQRYGRARRRFAAATCLRSALSRRSSTR